MNCSEHYWTALELKKLRFVHDVSVCDITIVYTELKITVSHWPFSNQSYHFAKQSLIAITFTNGEAIDSL